MAKGWLKASAFNDGKKGKSPPLDPRYAADYNRGVSARRTEQNIEQLGNAAGDLGALMAGGLVSIIGSWWDVASDLVDCRPLCWIDRAGQVLMRFPRKIGVLVWVLALAAFWTFMARNGIDHIEPVMLRGYIIFSILGCGLLGMLPVIIGGMLRCTAGAIAMFLIAVWQLIKFVGLLILVCGILFILFEVWDHRTWPKKHFSGMSNEVNISLEHYF